MSHMSDSFPNQEKNDGFIYEIQSPEFGDETSASGIHILTLESLLTNNDNEVFIKTKVEYEVDLVHKAALVNTQVTDSGSFIYEFANGMKILSDKILKLTPTSG